jgi:hypothetical protein
MRKIRMVLAAGMFTALASGTVVSASESGVGAAAAAKGASKAVFCGANDAIDRESANVESVTGFLAILKSHPNQWNALKKNVPSGPLGTTVRRLINAVESAQSTGNTGEFISAVSSSGGDVDTYCGVQGNGRPLPAYFNKGTNTSFCSTFMPVYEAVGYDSSEAAALAALTTHQTQIGELASGLAALPKSIRSKAASLVSLAQTAIATKNAAPVTSDHSQNGPDVALYCGQNN